MATLYVPQSYRCINGTDADRVLVDMWGNLPDDIGGGIKKLFGGGKEEEKTA